MEKHQAPPSSQEIKDLILDFRARVDSLRDRINILLAAKPRYTFNPATPDAPLYAQFIGLETQSPSPLDGKPRHGLPPDQRPRCGLQPHEPEAA